MLLKLYGLVSLTVFVLAIGPFWQDPDNPKAHIDQWLFLTLVILLSPVVLPNMLMQRCRRRTITGFLGINLP